MTRMERIERYFMRNYVRSVRPLYRNYSDFHMSRHDPDVNYLLNSRPDTVAVGHDTDNKFLLMLSIDLVRDKIISNLTLSDIKNLKQVQQIRQSLR